MIRVRFFFQSLSFFIFLKSFLFPAEDRQPFTAELFVKKHYLQEISPLKRTYVFGDYGPEVLKIKEWLVLWQINQNQFVDNFLFNRVFDEKTLLVLKNIQKFLGLDDNGVVDAKMWEMLVFPLRKAFMIEHYPDFSLRDYLTHYALRHLQYRSSELFHNNQGPWIRSYMPDNYDGDNAYWCQSFVCTILDQAFSSVGEFFSEYYVDTDTCEFFRQGASARGLLISEREILLGKYIPKRGDCVLFFYNDDTEAHHTEIVYKILDADKGNMLTVGGNTNFAGNRNGVGVFLQKRNFFGEKDKRVEIVRMITDKEILEHRSYPSFVRELMRCYPQIVAYRDKKILVEPMDKYQLKREYILISEIKDQCRSLKRNFSQRNFDHRVINKKFFESLYGDSQESVEKNLREINWCSGFSKKKIQMTSINKVAFKMKLMSEIIEKNPAWKLSASKIGLSYNSSGRSDCGDLHYFGIAFDVNLPYRKIPADLITFFETYGFMCVFHDKTSCCHFEYRPEAFF